MKDLFVSYIIFLLCSIQLSLAQKEDRIIVMCKILLRLTSGSNNKQPMNNKKMNFIFLRKSIDFTEYSINNIRT